MAGRSRQEGYFFQHHCIEMIKILNTPQIRDLDAYTIRHEPIASINLMERAARTFTNWFIQQWPDTNREITVVAGPGNNGGDGLAIARMLYRHFYPVNIILCQTGSALSDDAQTNLQRLPPYNAVPVHRMEKSAFFPEIKPQNIIIDALFGSGLNRPLDAYWGRWITHLNELPNLKVSVDMPSGLPADAPSTGIVFKADHTFSFELPKLAFFFPENQEYLGRWTFAGIGLHPEGLRSLETDHYFVDFAAAKGMRKPRKRFDHKGTFGHCLIAAGSYGKMGAAILAARAALRSGAGLVTIHAPRCGYEILQIAFPEAMVSVDPHQTCFSEPPPMENYQSVGAGCGWGQNGITAKGLELLLENTSQPLVLDADALNLLSKAPALLDKVPKGSILTPHPKEFERLFGKTGDSFEKLRLQREHSVTRSITIVLKGAYTCTTTPEGKAYFNGSGNPGMATAGSGDVLTGLIAGLLAQHYSPEQAAVLGVFIHGSAGDLAAEKLEHEALLAGDLIDYIGPAFHKLSNTAGI